MRTLSRRNKEDKRTSYEVFDDSEAKTGRKVLLRTLYVKYCCIDRQFGTRKTLKSKQFYPINAYNLSQL